MIGLLNIILSAIIGLIAILQIYFYNKRKLKIISIVDDTFSQLQTTIINIGKRKVYIGKLEIGYGTSRSNQQIILEKTFKQNLQLDDGQCYINTFTRKEIIEKRRKNEVKQNYWQTIWINVEISTRTRFSKAVVIDPQIIEKSYKKANESYIAADTFIGFPQIRKSKDYMIIK